VVWNKAPMATANLAWGDAETILLDMDGTLLDLAFDNYFWRELMPRHVARSRGVPPQQIVDELFAEYRQAEGSLRWYCLDHWSERFGLDLVALKVASSQRIRYLPGAREFLIAARSAGKRLVLVTNAHGKALAVKKSVAGLSRYLDGFLSSHELGFAKEQAAFWPALRERLGFDPASTVFMDDSLPVLTAARAYGLGEIYAISQPDSRQAVRQIAGFPVIRGLGELLD